jgi:crotonobetainyl-CoA:carnitine CoA-transferase CaiB-like acyl-CoA transferase
MIAPVNNIEDIAADQQLSARGFWEKIEHPELGASVVYCGAFAKMSETPLTCRRRPPLIGEHNLEIYAGEMKMRKETLTDLTSAGII